jgi:hypothetical protein
VFVRAVLEMAAAVNRKESGAAITPFEVSNTLDRYVDTGFDGPAGSPVRKAKAKARENYLNALRRTSGRAREFYEGDGAKKPDVSLADRTAELRAEGKTKEQALDILWREGFNP